MPKLRSKTYKTLEIKIPAEFVEPIKGVTATPGTWQRPFQHMQNSFKKVGDDWVTVVRESDIKHLKKFSANPKAGNYQKWSADILKLNERD